MKEQSNKAYRALKGAGALPPMQALVLGCVGMNGVMTRAEIAAHTGMRLSSVCGRVNELIDRKLLEEFGTVKDKVSGKEVGTVRVVGAEWGGGHGS